MIDYEIQIFNAVYPDIAPLCAKNRFISCPVSSLTAFPTVSLVEMANTTVRNRQSSSMEENYARIAYQLDVYAQSKKECKEVYAAADNAMMKHGFTRFSGSFIDYPENTKLFRYTARYEAEIDKNGVIYRRS